VPLRLWPQIGDFPLLGFHVQAFPSVFFQQAPCSLLLYFLAARFEQNEAFYLRSNFSKNSNHVDLTAAPSFIAS
jgi:hypothetical protein